MQLMSTVEIFVFREVAALENMFRPSATLKSHRITLEQPPVKQPCSNVAYSTRWLFSRKGR